MSSAMWYKNGNFYDVPTTHVNFFLENPELLGFSREEKERICVENGLSPDATFCPEQSDERVDILLEVMKRGAIRIRFYGGKTSIQCYDYNYGMNRRELQNCVMDGMGSVFGDIITVMDTKGWGEMLNNMGWGTQIKDFIAAALERRNRRRTIMDGRDRNRISIDEVFGSTDFDRMTCSLIECRINLDRIIKKHGDNGFAVVSACKNPEEHPEWNNEEESDELEKLIQEEGYSYTVGWGGYEGIDNDTYNASYEKSFIIYNYISFDNWHENKEAGDINRLRDFAVRMCGEFEQESIYFKAPGKAPVWLDSNGKVVSKNSSTKTWKNDGTKPYFTSLKDESSVEKELREKLKHIYKIQIQKENKPYREEEFEEFFQKNKGNRDLIKTLGRRFTADISSAFNMLLDCNIMFINKQSLGFQARYRQSCRGEIGVRPDE